MRVPLTERQATLTDRQARVLELAARGLKQRQISSVLDIAPATVKEHLAAARRKLHAQSVAHAITIASRAGLIEL